MVVEVGEEKHELEKIRGRGWRRGKERLVYKPKIL